MIISATFSKPTPKVFEVFGKSYLKIKAKLSNSDGSLSYFLEAFTEKQAFHFTKTEVEFEAFVEEHAGKTFKACVIKTEVEEITILSNKKGKITKLSKPLSKEKGSSNSFKNSSTLSKTSSITPSKILTQSTAQKILRSSAEKSRSGKNYLIPEGKPVPFMVMLGIMTAEGKVISSKYDKFRQINRFLEFIDDIIPKIIKMKDEEEKTALQKEKYAGAVEKSPSPLRIIDFGCGKSYLTFAVHYFLTETLGLPVEIIGLDLKKEVIDYCNKTACALNLKGLTFSTGDIKDYEGKKNDDSNNIDLVITLHACDTATDYALDYAVKNSARAILSVPCCQHEINSQLEENIKKWKKNEEGGIPEDFSALLEYGIVRERFSALLTDALRCRLLESKGYSVQLLEFIDMEHTPKNLLIRAVRKETFSPTLREEKILTTLGLSPTLKRLFNS